MQDAQGLIKTSRVTSAVFFMLFAATSSSVAFANESADESTNDAAYEAAIANMGEHPDVAERMVNKRDDAVGLLDRMLFLFAFKDDSPARTSDIQALQIKIDQAVARLTDGYMRAVVGPTVVFDGTALSLEPTIVLASSTGFANTHSAFYAIPCAVLQKKPELLDVTAPMFGGNRDNFMPRSGCVWGRGEVADYPIDALSSYMYVADGATGDMFGPNQGSIRFAQAAAQQWGMQIAMLDPDALLPAPPGSRKPFEVWSYLSWANRDVFNAITRELSTTRKALISYWQSNGKDRETATEIARNTLFSVVYGADCDTAVPLNSLRVMLVDDRPLTDIENIAQQNTGQDGDLFENCAAYAGIDPLLHIAVARPESLDVLRANGYFDDVEARNGFGKTALMAAAQRGSLTAVKWLLDHGADVAARTDPGDEWLYPRHGQRTALHYAAASGAIEIVKVLIKAGAECSATDDLGFSGRDYLLGRDDLPGNATISAADQAALLQILDPDGK